MKKIYMVVLSLLVIFSFTMSATALTQKTMDRQNGMAANGEWMQTTPDGITTDTYLSVTQTNYGTEVNLYMYSYDNLGYWSSKYGYKVIQNDAFSIDKQLNSAKLKAVQIDLYEWKCDEYGNNCMETLVDSPTIDVNWAGNGDITKGSFKATSRFGDYMSKYSESSSRREATVTGSFNGNDLGLSYYGNLVIFKQVSISMQK